MQLQNIHVTIPTQIEALDLPPRLLDHVLATLTPQHGERIELERQKDMIALQATFTQRLRGTRVVEADVTGVEV